MMAIASSSFRTCSPAACWRDGGDGGRLRRRSLWRRPFQPPPAGVREIWEALQTGARNTLIIGATLGVIGIIVGTISLTGIGLKFSDIIISAAGGNLLLAVLLIAFAVGLGVAVSAQERALRQGTAAAAAIALFGLSNIHADGAAVELGAVEGRDGLVGRLVIVEGDETETARAARVAIADHDGFADLAVGTERTAQAFVVRVPAQTSNKQFLRHSLLVSLSAPLFRCAPLYGCGGKCCHPSRSQPRRPAS